MSTNVRLLVPLLCVVCGRCTVAAGAPVAFELERPALTSAGVYDGAGRLVRVLWQMRELPAGRQAAGWDGLDQSGRAAPAGRYRVNVVVNGATYANVGAIGNSGQPADAAGHTPTNMEAVAVDQEGNVYTVNGWDEAGADFKRWDADGRSVYDARFQIRNGRPNGAPYAIAVDSEFIYCAVGGWDREPWDNRQQVQRFRLKDGRHVPFTGKSVASSTEVAKGAKVERAFKGPAGTLVDGHIQVYEWPALGIAAGTAEADARLMRSPLRAMDVAGATLYVADALGGKVRMFDTTTGEAKGDFAVHLPHAVAVDATGQIWVGHDHDTVTAFRADGYSGVTYGNLGEVTALSFGPGNKLYASDAKGGRVMTLDAAANPARFVPVLGEKARSGDRAADRFYALRGVAADGKGNLFTVQREPGSGGARLAKWASTSATAAPGAGRSAAGATPRVRSGDFDLAWEHFATEFVSLGNYGVSDPDTLYTISHHRHRLLDRAKGTWEYLGNAYDLAAFPTSERRFDADPHGVVRVLRIDKRDFVFMPKGDGVQVYRADGAVLRLASLIGGRDPGPTGEKGAGAVTKWTWSDGVGGGRPGAGAIGRGGDHYTCFGMDVDARANVWFANTHTHSIWRLPLGGLDGRGNPTYDWRMAREVVPRDGGELGFDPSMVQAAADGTFYAFGWSKRWPTPQDNPFWMGGTTLCRYDANGARLWAVELPQACVGMDVVPARAGKATTRPGAGVGAVGDDTDSPSAGVLVGGGKGGVIYHYSAGGLLLNHFKPGKAMGEQTGWLDNHASVAANRDPRDGVVDVFVEDDLNCRIGWYRVNDGGVRTFSGVVVKP